MTVAIAHGLVLIQKRCEPLRARSRQESPDAVAPLVGSRAEGARACVGILLLERRAAFRAGKAWHPGMHSSRLPQHDQKVIAPSTHQRPRADDIVDVLERVDERRMTVGERVQVRRRREQTERAQVHS